jgi:hypothetical protein
MPTKLSMDEALHTLIAPALSPRPILIRSHVATKPHPIPQEELGVDKLQPLALVGLDLDLRIDARPTTPLYDWTNGAFAAVDTTALRIEDMRGFAANLAARGGCGGLSL